MALTGILQSRTITTILLLLTLPSVIESRALSFLMPSEGSPLLTRSYVDTDLSSFQVPLSNGTSSLPPPTSALKAITLGRGTQNYTCNSTSSPPTLLGARASLLDLSPLLSYLPPTSIPDASTILALIPAYTLGFSTDALIKQSGLDVIGHHIFNAKGVPCFVFKKSDDEGSAGGSGLGTLKAKKVGDVVAPGGHAVDWLMLERKPDVPISAPAAYAAGAAAGDGEDADDTNAVLQSVYRVDTAGGKPGPEGCGGKKHVEVEYAALYYFYGT